MARNSLVPRIVEMHVIDEDGVDGDVRIHDGDGRVVLIQHVSQIVELEITTDPRHRCPVKSVDDGETADLGTRTEMPVPLGHGLETATKLQSPSLPMGVVHLTALTAISSS